MLLIGAIEMVMVVSQVSFERRGAVVVTRTQFAGHPDRSRIAHIGRVPAVDRSLIPRRKPVSRSQKPSMSII
jgi:hypothetical protein